MLPAEPGIVPAELGRVAGCEGALNARVGAASNRPPELGALEDALFDGDRDPLEGDALELDERPDER